ncbi:cytochrome P450 [Chitinophaga varians]|uniref:Cytochrome P450 n=1 Tax=Chitinophaga varians TaxID=2202339 RepID=A0A847RKX1_9BACT|nr:cytochrome P450 [Chitinophaga varians]NLR67659.1 cytochrome P450 [Chitinophaga varians]
MFSATVLDPAPWYHQMRAQNPVYFDPEFTFFYGAKGSWLLFTYDDVKWALSDHETFSSEYLPTSGEDLLGATIFATDPPRHRKMRALVTKAFSPATISRMGPWLYEQCYQLIAPWLESGEMDFVSAFAAPLPSLVISRLLGAPKESGPLVTSWGKTLSGDPRTIGMEVYYQTMKEMSDFLSQLIAERAVRPQQDLITDLLQAEVDGEKLTDKEILATCITVLSAGSETTESWLTSALHLFIQHPTLQKHLATHTADLPKALTEAMRFRSPVMAMPRRATRDITLRGQTIPKDSLVNLCIGAANLDPAAFPDPDNFDINRDNSRMLSFGHGIHYCIGSMLARLETRIAFEVLFKHMQHIRIKPGATIVRTPSTIVYSYQELPIVFDLSSL